MSANSKPPESLRTVWRCPICGSDEVQGVAWCRLNETSEHDDEGGSYTLARVESWDEDYGFFCDDCADNEETGHDGMSKHVCEVQPDGHCLTHDRQFEKCRKEYAP
jgi:hypothetical protein